MSENDKLLNSENQIGDSTPNSNNVDIDRFLDKEDDKLFLEEAVSNGETNRQPAQEVVE